MSVSGTKRPPYEPKRPGIVRARRGLAGLGAGAGAFVDSEVGSIGYSLLVRGPQHWLRLGTPHCTDECSHFLAVFAADLTLDS